jgi:hypothetical protein
MRLLAFDVRSLADTVTKTAIALLTLLAALIAGVGLVRAWRSRRRPQIVVEDIQTIGSFSPAVLAGLSPQLRDGVHRALTEQRLAAEWAHKDTIVADVNAGLLTAPFTSMGIESFAELRASAADSLAALSAGVRVLDPGRAESVLEALSTVLPVQRGWVVRTSPVVRRRGARSEIGISVQLGEIGHLPEAVTAFWTETVADRAPDQTASADLYDLVRPTANWIAIRLVAQNVSRSRAASNPRIRSSRSVRDQQLAGVRHQLAGQLSLYALDETRYPAGFAEQALGDLREAARLLPDYFRPFSTQAAVHERVGWSHRRTRNPDSARLSFLAAVSAYDRAEELIAAPTSTATERTYDDVVARIEGRRTKCRILSADEFQLAIARRELLSLREQADPPAINLYNLACLYAVASRGAASCADEAEQYARRAWELLGRSLLAAGPDGPWQHALVDEELEGLDARARVRFVDALRHTARSGVIASAEARGFVRNVLTELSIVVQPT